jgi:hypothetical protein
LIGFQKNKKEEEEEEEKLKSNCLFLLKNPQISLNLNIKLLQHVSLIWLTFDAKEYCILEIE